MKKMKSFTAGVLVGAIITGSITIFAGVPSLIEATLTEFKIVLDGKEMKIPEEYAVLNYNGRTYTPARLVAEALGATVEWLPETETVDIKSPEPKIVEKEVIKEVPVEKIVEKIVEVPAKRDYEELPVRSIIGKCSIEIIEVSTSKDYTSIRVAIDNASDELVDLYLDYDNAYLMSGTTKIAAKGTNYNSGWRTPTEKGEQRENELTFDAIGSNSDEEITVVLPFIVRYVERGKSENKTLTFYVDYSD